MPKAQRSPEEIESVRLNIMEHALELIVTDGYDHFSMRKLGARLGVAAKTIYNYFHSRDELYLCILTKGFEQLYDLFESAAKPQKDPLEQLAALIRAYVNFGLEHANIYNLMFTWHVPKYNDYVGTPMEQAATAELTTALKCRDFFLRCISACLGEDVTAKEEAIGNELVQIWSYMHGYVAGINNSLLDYMHDDPVSLKNLTIDRIITGAQRDLTTLKERLKLKAV